MTKDFNAMKSGYYFLFHTLSLLLKGSSKIKNKVILIKYSRPIGMFPATQFWVATPRLRTTGLKDLSGIRMGPGWLAGLVYEVPGHCGIQDNKDAFLLYITQILGSNLGPETGYSD
jgi:hypothetical protein